MDRSSSDGLFHMHAPRAHRHVLKDMPNTCAGDSESPEADAGAKPKRARHDHQQPAQHAQHTTEGDDLFEMQVDEYEPPMPQPDEADALPGEAELQEAEQDREMGADALAEAEMPDEAELEDMADAEGLPIEQ